MIAHALVWAIVAPDMLGLHARQLVADEQTVVQVSAISVYEMASKVRLGKWPEASVVLEHLDENLAEARFERVPLSAKQALLAAQLPSAHRDPFDRMLAATALEQDIPLVSLDRSMDDFAVRRIW